MFHLKNNYLDDEYPWEGILEATSFAVVSTYHTMFKFITSQLMSRVDMMLNKHFIYDWEANSRRKNI